MPSKLVKPAFAGTLAVVASFGVSTAASAVPITVHLRVEGATSTLFDGDVTTDARSITAPTHGSTAQPTQQPCDLAHNGMNGGFGSHTATPVSALYDASVQTGVRFAATWFPSFNDFLVDGFGSDVSPDAATMWGYAVNYTTAGVGGCEFQLAPGSDVLWAANYASPLLKLSGPTSANAGSPVLFNVVDGTTGLPVQGVSVGSAATDANGNATLNFPVAGLQSLKADKTGAVRSAAFSLCVHNGNDGTCSTPAPVAANFLPPLAHVIASRRYRHGRGPRSLHGYVTVNQPLKAVLLRLTRRARGGKCSYYSGSAEAFRTVRCGRGSFFTVGNASTFSYLLPRRLGRGHYSLEAEATALDGSRDVKLERGRNWSVFDVG